MLPHGQDIIAVGINTKAVEQKRLLLVGLIWKDLGRAGKNLEFIGGGVKVLRDSFHAAPSLSNLYQ